MSEYIETPRYNYGQGNSDLTMASPSPTGAPRISISTETDLPPAYDEARNRNLVARNPSDVPSLHTPSIIDLPHHPAEHTDAGRLGGAFDGPDIMPSLSMLAQPSELFPDAAPYYIMLTCVGPTARISGSHQPSLRLIAEYFKRWGRTSPPKPGLPQNVSHFCPPISLSGSVGRHLNGGDAPGVIPWVDDEASLLLANARDALSHA